MSPTDVKLANALGSGISATELDAWAGLVRVHAQLTRELDARIVSTHGLALTEYEVLMRLASSGGSMRMSDLADAALLSRSGMTRVIDELEDLGYVVRRESRDDRRGLVAALTEEGVEHFVSARDAHLANIRELFLEPLGEPGQCAMADAWAAIEQALPAELAEGGSSRGIRTRRRHARRRAA